MWWILASAAWGQGTGPDGAPLTAELLDPAVRVFAERPAAVGPRKALELESRAVLLLTEAGRAVDPTPLLDRRRKLLEAAWRSRSRALEGGGSDAEHAALAYLLQDLGEPELAAEAWREVLRRAPDSPWGPTAALFLAARASAEGDDRAAAELLRVAAEDPVAGPFARYQLAWVYQRLSRPDAALAALLSIVDTPDPALAEDARRGALRVASGIGGGAVDQVLERICAGDAACVLAALAELGPPASP
jgi:tetratricopeptide (TPR) repeat protein